MGMLRVTGTIALKQFWPKGKSDADTATIIVRVDARTAFQYQESAGSPFRTTRAFEGTLVHGRHGAKPPIDDKGRIRVRLQGLDAPELHYRPSPLSRRKRDELSADKKAAFRKLNKEYKQHWSESATFALLQLLEKAKKPVLDCEVTTRVNEPTDVFDTYGRLVGDIEVRIRGTNYNLNRWLIRKGWAFPGFYDSMKNQEIDVLLNAWKRGSRGRLASDLSNQVGRLDFDYRYRTGKTAKNFQLGEDAGVALFPKVYRRLVTWSVYRKAGITNLSFRDHVAAGRDQYLDMADYKQNQQAATKRGLETALRDGRFTLKPEDAVYVEDANSQLKRGPELVRTWF